MRKLLLILFILIVILFVLNIDVSTRRGINYQVQTLKIPLYLKLLDFFDRHYNYTQLVRGITAGVRTDEEKVMKIFEWTFKNISKAPEGLPIVDDHVWNIIIRGYGVNDQFQDVFTTLCNYAGINAFFAYANSSDGKKKIPLSFVYFDKGWRVFDAYNGVYFRNSRRGITSINDSKLVDWHVICLDKRAKLLDYSDYLQDLGSIGFEASLSRPSIQSPIKRVAYFLKNGR